MPDVYILGDAATLLWGKVAPSLGSELQFIALSGVSMMGVILPMEARNRFGKGISLTFVTASWKCSSVMGWAELFEKANVMWIELLAPVARPARKSVRNSDWLMVPLCSLGLLDAAGGSDDEKFHSSSSLETAAGWGGGGVEVDAAPKAANGSAAGWDGGGLGC